MGPIVLHGCVQGRTRSLTIRFPAATPMVYFIQEVNLLASYQKRKIAGCACAGNVFPPRNSDPDMHHGTCVTNVPWCMPGSLTSGFLWSRWRENVPGIPGACATRNFTYLLRGPCFAELPLKFNCCSVKLGWMFLIKKGHWPVSWTQTPALSD